MTQKGAAAAATTGKLIRNPDNPFEAFDEYGRPCLPMTLGDDCPSSGTTPGPFGNTDPGTGRSLMSSLVTSLNWAIGQTDHPQIPLRIGDAAVLVDRDMAELIDLLNRAHVETVTSCIGTAKAYGYVMILGLGSILRFQRFWEDHLVPLGHMQPTLDLDARDAQWRADTCRDYPVAQKMPILGGLTHTAIWKEYSDDMPRMTPVICGALRRHLRAADEAQDLVAHPRCDRPERARSASSTRHPIA